MLGKYLWAVWWCTMCPNPRSAKKGALGCDAYPFYRKFGRACMHGHPVHGPWPVARLMQMLALGVAICMSHA